MDLAMFDHQRNQLLQALDVAHVTYSKAEVFGGPSLYFHQQALLAAKAQNFEAFAEKVYAVLAAWGMHRMGSGGSKMCEFDVFRHSLKCQWPRILSLQHASPGQLDESDWNDLRGVFCGICCMKTATSLVGNSKVMAHALPGLIPPIDREYTLKFLYGSGNITNGKDGEWARMKEILENFFYPVLLSTSFQSKAIDWERAPDPCHWDTSPLKIVDNLIIGYMKYVAAKAGASSEPITR